MLETAMGQYFRKWLVAEGLFEENYRPTGEEVRFYANGKQRTIATAQYFSSGFLPVANSDIICKIEYNKMDPVFTPKLTFVSDKYIEDATKQMKANMNDLTSEYNLLMLGLPNLPDDDLVPGGKENNVAIRYFGEPHVFDFQPQHHVDLCTKLGLIDYERGVKMGGNGYWLYTGEGAKLEWALLNYFITEHIKDLGTSACPPYHLAICIGGTSAEMCLSTVKKASAGYLDELPTSGNEGGRCFRDLEWEEKVLKICRESGIGAQFGGKYFVHDVRVIRAPRHAASCPVAIGVSCSADRNIKAKITPEGIFLEQLEKNPACFLPAEAPAMSPAVEIDLDEGMDKVRETLTKYPIKTRLNLKGTLIVARDIAHARIKQMVDNGEPMPEYFKKHPVYYAGPAKTPAGMASGSFGPTTAGRMDPYVDLFQSLGGSMVMVAKGNRSQEVTDACQKHGGFYLGSIGGPAAILAKNSIKSVEVVDFPELGMEAVRKIYVENFPAFIIVDDKGNDFFADFKH